MEAKASPSALSSKTRSSVASLPSTGPAVLAVSVRGGERPILRWAAQKARRRPHRPHGYRLGTFGTGAHLELHRLPVRQRPVVASLNGRLVNEHIAAAVSDEETETLPDVEPLHLAGLHRRTPPACSGPAGNGSSPN